MKKYLAIAKITFANILQYRWEYLISQSRTVILLITLYFLWTKIFFGRFSLFGFDKQQIITYVFLAAILREFVIVSATDQIAGELQSWGKFFSYLLRPIGYLRYWFTVDLVYKLTSLVSITIIVSIILRVSNLNLVTPQEVQTIPIFTIFIILAVLMYFFIGILVSTAGFWTYQVWGLQFLVTLVLEFAAGAFFPIDVLPQTAQSLIRLTPFPYLLYYPISIFLERIPVSESIRLIMIGLLWLAVIYLVTNFVWKKGLKVYEAWGG